MATYGDIIAEVALIIPRPELDDIIRTKINQTIRYISAAGKFWRDIEEVTIGSADGVDALANIQTIPITNLVRSLVYVQYPSAVEKPPQILCLELSDLKRRNDCALLGDVAYLSGTTLHIRNSTLSSTFNLAYYTHPAYFLTDGTEDGNSNWITDLAPGLVVDMAAAYILNLKGDNEDSARISQLASLMQASYIRDFVSSIE